ncbi:unnamed protein product [Phytophthora lilii]|uniref:Unnamed protein product n=1 Tax=Phytophthora lilii TaxID=2077276 RepID=A0A9W6TEM8_9STRA|nr:unnamed protein product [Phytophthora lilii]
MRGHQSNMQSIVKRKIREEDDCEADRKVKATYVPQNDEKVSEQETTQQEEYAQCSIPGLRFATESWTGMKTSNEDRHIASTRDFPGPVFGIFDGHGGTFSADFLARQLVKTVSTEIKQKIGARALADMQRLHELSKHESIRRDALVEQIKLLRDQLAEVGAIMSEPASPNLGRSKVSNASDTDDVRDLFDQLTTTILQMDSEVNHIDVEEATRQGARLQWFERQDNNILASFKDAFERVDKQILKKNSSQDGSTALLVWFLDHSTSSSGNEIKNGKQPMKDLMFYTVNVGDCRAVMCRGGQGVSLTSDHKPDRPDEKQRIEKAGGFVSKIAGIARVYSAAGAGLALKQETSTYLAVSRAFGDRSLKIPTQLVSCEPEVKRFQLQNDDLFLVMACDGVWDVLSEQEVVDIALPLFRDAKAAADAVIKAAYKKGSVDNLTATVVQFGWKSDAQVQRTIESNKATKSSTPKGRNEEAKVDDSDEEIDMFNL